MEGCLWDTLDNSLPSKSGWEQAEGLQLAQGRACFLPETTRCTGRWEAHSSPLQGVVSCELSAGVTLVLASHLRGRTGTGTRQDCPQTQVSLAHKQSGLVRPGELDFPQPQIWKYCYSHTKRQWGCLDPNPGILVPKARQTTQNVS